MWVRVDSGSGSEFDEDEADYERRFMTAQFLSMPGPKGDMTKVQAKKIVVGLGERNMNRTVAIALTVDSEQFCLPTDFLKKGMNKYELESGDILYAPYPLWESAAEVAQDKDEEIPEDMVKKLQKRTELPTGGPTHPCPDECEKIIVSK